MKQHKKRSWYIGFKVPVSHSTTSGRTYRPRDTPAVRQAALNWSHQYTCVAKSWATKNMNTLAWKYSNPDPQALTPDPLTDSQRVFAENVDPKTPLPRCKITLNAPIMLKNKRVLTINWEPKRTVPKLFTVMGDFTNCGLPRTTLALSKFFADRFGSGT